MLHAKSVAQRDVLRAGVASAAADRRLASFR
jgi:hypothetical protein